VSKGQISFLIGSLGGDASPDFVIQLAFTRSQVSYLPRTFEKTDPNYSHRLNKGPDI